jgi:hypothetical protein
VQEECVIRELWFVKAQEKRFNTEDTEVGAQRTQRRRAQVVVSTDAGEDGTQEKRET